tara:strand:+ start:2550 stop:3509 length:960 start_codon:yes stop_codon:yes gene_type:complete
VNHTTYNCCIIGCGLIGSKLKSNPNGKYNFNHYDAIASNKYLSVNAIYDLNKKNCISIREKNPKIQILDRIECIKSISSDIIIIATPETERKKIIEQILQNKNIKVVLMEKPVANNLANTKGLINLLKSNGKTVVINFTRLWDPNINIVKREIKTILGSFEGGTCSYTKSLSNTGSHAISLILEILDIDINKINNNEDHEIIQIRNHEINLMKKKITFNQIDTSYSILDIMLYFEKGCLCIKGAGGCKIDIFESTNSIWEGYKEINDGKIIKDKYYGNMDYIYQNIVSYLQGHINRKEIDNSALGLCTAKIVEALEKSY